MLPRIIALVALVQLAGGHWTAMQCVAWANMFASYVREYPVAESLAKTFDPEKPCSLCKSIRAGQEREQKLPSVVSRTVKIEGVIVNFQPLLGPDEPLRKDYSEVAQAQWTVRRDAPSPPVPRFSC
jgi:hypothetical protein